MFGRNRGILVEIAGRWCNLSANSVSFVVCFFESILQAIGFRAYSFDAQRPESREFEKSHRLCFRRFVKRKRFAQQC